MSWIESLGRVAGRAAAAFLGEVKASGGSSRPDFLRAWAESEKWNGGDWGRAGAQQRAFQNSWLAIALDLVGREVSAAEFQVIEQANLELEPKQVANHPLERLLRRPNPWIGRAFLWVYSIFWYFMDGNFYWFISCDESGEPVEIWPLPANQVQVWPGDADRFIDHYKYFVNGREYRIPTEYIVHVRRPNGFDIFRGMGVLMQAMLPVDSDLAMAIWNGAFFGQDNVMPSAIINLSSGNPDKPINPADADALKLDLRSEYAAVNRKTAITTANSLSAVLLGWNAKDMDFLSGRQAMKEEILLLVGVPPGMVDKNATEANAVVGERVFKNNVWTGPLTMISEQITAELVIPFYGEQYAATFGDIRVADRALELEEIAAAEPYLEINEVRKRFWKLPPVPWGNKPARELGQTMPVATPRPELPAGQHGLLPDQTGTAPAPATGKSLAAAKVAPADLRRWREKALKNFKATGRASVPFASDAIPGDIKSAIRSALVMAQTSDEVKAIFESPRPWSAIELSLAAALRQALESEARRLAADVLATGDGLVEQEAWWVEHRVALMDAVTDSLEQIAGLGAEAARTMLGEGVTAGVNWNLVNANAQSWGRQYAAELVRSIEPATRDAVRQAVADWTTTGEPLSKLAERIESLASPNESGTVFSPQRARMIAQTESTNVYANGNAVAWTAAGVAPAVMLPGAHVGCRCRVQPKQMAAGSWVMVWLTVEDELVCTDAVRTPWGLVDGCRDLNNTVVSAGPMLGKKA